MFTNKLYLDGNDVYSSYGAILGEGSYKNLLEWPVFKELSYNDWHEENGLEVDLSDPKLDTRTFELTFNFIGSQPRMDKFILQLSDLAYHTCIFVDISLSLTLRMVSIGGLDLTNGLPVLKVQLAHDEPLTLRNYTAPISNISYSEDYTLDGIPISEYGLRVLEGSLSSVKKPPDVKENLNRNISTLNGAIYYNGNVKYKAKDITLKCLMTADLLTGLINNYYTLFNELTETGTRDLYVDATSETYQCYYNSIKVTEVYTTGKLWLAFELVLTIPNPTVALEEFLLSTEDGLFITTEDSINYIDMEV